MVGTSLRSFAHPTKLQKIGGLEGPPIASFRRSFRLGRRA